MMHDAYRYGYFKAGTGKAAGVRMTIPARIRLWKRRRKQCDLQNLKGW